MNENTPMNLENNPPEAELTRLLSHAPEVHIPVDFAARLRSALPAGEQASTRTAATHQPPALRQRQGEGRSVAGKVATFCALLIAAALFVLAPHAQASVGNVVFWMELLLLAELGGIAYWLTVKRGFAK